MSTVCATICSMLLDALQDALPFQYALILIATDKPYDINRVCDRTCLLLETSIKFSSDVIIVRASFQASPWARYTVLRSPLLGLRSGTLDATYGYSTTSTNTTRNASGDRTFDPRHSSYPLLRFCCRAKGSVSHGSDRYRGYYSKDFR